MANFFNSQLDYISFFYGLSFLLLAQACLGAGKSGRKTLPWRWLGLFGLAHGVHEILELFAASVGDSEAFAALRLVVLAASFLPLLEFGRAGSAEYGGYEAKRWLFLPLIAAASLGANAGLAGMNASVRYSLGLTGGLWASYALIAASREDRSGGKWLKAAGITMAAYAVVAGFIVPPAPFPPSSLINTRSFFSQTHLPIQVIRTVAALLLSAFTIAYTHKSCGDENAEKQYMAIPGCSFRPLLMVLAITVAGWTVTQAVGDYGEGLAKTSFLARARTSVSAMDTADVASLTGTAADDGTPAFERVRDRLRAIRVANNDCRFVYLLGMKDGKIIFLADAEPKNSKDYSPPGEVYTDAKPRDFEDYRNAKETVYDPYTDSWGTWVTSAAYIRGRSGKVLAQLGMDMDARNWVHSVSVYRLFSIIITMILSGFSLAFYAAWQRSRESAEKGAALRVASQRLEDEKRLRALAYSLSEGVVLEEGGKVSFANPEAERLLGWSEEDMKGEALCEFARCRDAEHRDVKPDEFPTTKSAVSGAVCRMDDLYFTRRDGAIFPVSCVCSPIKDGGRQAGTVTTFKDITARKGLEKQKADFYAMVTHDLKSPLSIIQGYTDILLIDWRHKFDFETITVLNSIWDNCGRMLRLVNDFLTVSRFEYGRVSLNESLESISQMLAEIKEDLGVAAQKKGINLEVRAPDGLPRTVFDKAHVYRALQNLVENALAYSPPGGKVAVQAEAATVDGADYIRVSVTDEGPAIPDDEASKVSDMFYSSPRTAGIKGSGLGLAIAKGVAVAHGGRVDLKSSEGLGSTFQFLLPVKKS